jgi:predicted dithiol-disulfide oxidoreductase (DUF899 family)
MQTQNTPSLLNIVSRAEWLRARTNLLQREKELTRQRDGDATATHLPLDNNDTAAVALADVDGDRDLDLVVGIVALLRPARSCDEG